MLLLALIEARAQIEDQLLPDLDLVLQIDAELIQFDVIVAPRRRPRDVRHTVHGREDLDRRQRGVVMLTMPGAHVLIVDTRQHLLFHRV